MPERHVELAQRMVAAMDRGDRAELHALTDELVHPDCEWTPLIATGVEGATYRGRAGMRAFVEDLLGAFEVRYRDRDARAVGDRLVVMGARMELKGRGSEAAVDQELGMVLEFEDGLLRRGRAYPSRDDALRAAEPAVDA